MQIKQQHSACPHDCPSTCALVIDVETKSNVAKIGRVRGADHPYTAGVICAKVARYTERVYSSERLLFPLYRKNKQDEFKSISWDSALDIVAEQFQNSESKYGSQSIWPYHYAGTMGLVNRDSIERLVHAKGYSETHETICVNNAWTGFSAATGALRGPNPCEMAKSDCIIIWGTNAVATQVNVMTHAIKARKTNGAKIVAIDIYENDTVKQADLALILKPGTDAALACGVAHILFRDKLVDRDYLQKYTSNANEFEKSLANKTPQWASEITGLKVQQIESFARLIGENVKSYFRLGYGFTRTRNGSVAMHAACCLPTLTGAWAFEGGGAFHSNGDIYNFNSDLIKGIQHKKPNIRKLDQSRIGAILCGEKSDLKNGEPVTSMLIQSTNPMSVAPEQAKVKQGFARNDLFVAVHEQFLTETAKVANIVLPATMFVEHDDIYKGSGHDSFIYGGKIVEPPQQCRSNLEVIEGLAERLGVAHLAGFGMSANQHIDAMLQASNKGTLAELQQKKWIHCQPDFATSHYLDGFAHDDGKFHFKPDWQNVKWGKPADGLLGNAEQLPEFPDHWNVLETPTDDYPLRLATPPARSFLNSSFNETAGSQKKEGEPVVFIHPKTANHYNIEDGAMVSLQNQRGEVVLQAKHFSGVQPEVLIYEGLHANAAHKNGCGINTLTGAEPTAPHGGAAFHDVKVSIQQV